MAASVLVYTTTYCGYCMMAKRLLKQKGARFEEIDVSDRHELRTWLVEASGQRTVPQIFINGQSVGGFDDLAALERRGELTARLAEDPSVDDPLLPR
jgi:glutaredoxin 3